MLCLTLALFVGGTTNSARAANLDRSYVYDQIQYQFDVEKDTTIRVQEIQTYHFQGEYHQGNRNIPLSGVDLIDTVSVKDINTGQPLVYSSSRLDKTDPSSYGRYTTYRENGQFVIEWYYTTLNTTHTWALQYTLHGAVSFLDDKDELYWNLFTEYQVPVKEVRALVILPQDFSVIERQAFWYTDPVVSAGTITYPDNHSLLFLGQNFPAFGKATIAAGWPRGALERSLYWKSFVERFIWVILAILIVCVSIASVGGRYFLTEHWRTGRGTLVPEYAPPQALPPAMVEVLIRESVSEKVWSATIIDLAVRGFLKIEEIPVPRIKQWGRIILGSVVLIGAIAFLAQSGIPWFAGVLIFVIFFLRFGIYFLMSVGKHFLLFPKNYIITRLQKEGAAGLEAYEQQFLDILFPHGKTEFSTKEIKKISHQTEQREMHAALQKLRRILLEETAADTAAYVVGFKTWHQAKNGLIVGLIVVFIGLFTIGQKAPLLIIPGLISLYVVVWAVLFFRYNPRLNYEGQVFKEKWLGFKLYLETAEKYRLQNLTPETFEKYLPYAIIFGVEKKWGQAFEYIALEPPAWYRGTTGMSGSAIGGNFSVAHFSSALGVSFTSAFSRAGGGGASSGGGRAGGAGGGGGGGAS